MEYVEILLQTDSPASWLKDIPPLLDVILSPYCYFDVNNLLK